MSSVLCCAPKGLLANAIRYARMLCDKHPGRNFDDVLMGVRAEHAFANLCGTPTQVDNIARQQQGAPDLFDLVYVDRVRGITRRIDVKAKWSMSDSNLSSHNEKDVDYVFLYPFDPRVSISHNIDLVYAVAGWVSGAGLQNAPPHLRAQFFCEPDRLRDVIHDSFF